MRWLVMLLTALALTVCSVQAQPRSPFGSFPHWKAALGVTTPLGPPLRYRLSSRPPVLLLSLPKYTAWLASVRRHPLTATTDTKQGEVHVWRHPRGGQLVAVWLPGGALGGRAYWLNGRRLQWVTLVGRGPRVFITQVGVYRWEHRYRQGRLQLLLTHRSSVGTRRRVYDVRRYDYRPGATVPYRYVSYADMAALRRGVWQRCGQYSLLGRILLVHHRRSANDRCPY